MQDRQACHQKLFKSSPQRNSGIDVILQVYLNINSRVYRHAVIVLLNRILITIVLVVVAVTIRC